MRDYRHNRVKRKCFQQKCVHAEAMQGIKSACIEIWIDSLHIVNPQTIEGENGYDTHHRG